MAAKRGSGRKRMGRPKGSGGPPEKVRRNRIVVMVRDEQLAALHRLADSRGLPLGTVAFEIFEKGLRRTK